jgi:transcriptional regulator with XRE-family HTH domain
MRCDDGCAPACQFCFDSPRVRVLAMTPLQARMARAACGVTIEEVCAVIGISRMALNNAEQGRKPLGLPRWSLLQQWYEQRGVLFGPGHWVGMGADVMAQDKAMILALFALLHEHGIQPTSAEIVAALHRQAPPVRPCAKEGSHSHDT